MTLRDELTMLADSARSYGDPDAAIRTARRRRIAGLVAAPAMAVVAVAGLLVGPYWRLATTRAPSAPSGGIDLTVAGSARALPADRAVGRAALAYAVAGRTWLVTRDGHRYELPSALSETSLSPDGRWLVLDGQLRDLTGGARRSLPGRRVRAWSPNSAQILVEDSGQEQWLVDPTSGQYTAVVSGPAIAVLNDGNAVGAETGGSASPKVVTLALLNPHNGAQQREVVVDARAALVGNEAIKGPRVWFGPHDQALFAVAGGAASTHTAVLVSLRAPKRVTPVPRAAGSQRWLPLGFFDGAVLLKSEADRTAVELRAWRDGHSSPLFRLPAGSAVLAPGGVRAS